MNPPVLSVKNLATHFFTRAGVVKAVDDVSFDLAEGEIMGLVGESGSGKTVTGFSLLGLVDAPGRIVEGSVKLNGTELTTLSGPELRKRRGREISMIFQDPIATLNPMLTIGQQMQMAIDAHERLSKRAAMSRAAEFLTQVGIPSAQARLRSYPHEFSGGMRQRVAIAIALLHRPAVLVADEPTTALDVSIQAQILFQMRDLAAQTGTAMIWISHDLAVVSSLASKLAVMYAGRIVEQGPTAKLLRDPRHPYTAGLIASLPSMAKPGTPLTQIRGTTPSLLSLPEGCPFAPRCDYRTDACAQKPDMTLSEGRGWRCFHPTGQDVGIPA
ncbi:ABC transporter ATP-binding protein [Sulfitobacter guttiformis]|uniref:Peptide/nickel transport system ATP-binding protein n=1 Tax=Sulfitobacter guttiformis TaxID=74349 RepID=A0A420DTL0_9RHOB|nr:ABC transporter ATP-binding protein [Sulfitobacter guttiformis]KIN71034.1 Oligopeptide/dipeptide transporter domain family protein [Sulfitobacter guttiformis KCTC 32187]RKE97518.1 peptide/nickel transport system ATP-binding protein [Sulfitobacter guttiformis]